MVLEVQLFLSPPTCTRIWTNMWWGILAGSDCMHTIWEWSLANGMVFLAIVINVSVEKFTIRSMCFFFCKCAEVCELRMRYRDLFEGMFETLHAFAPSKFLLNLFLSWLVITVSLILRSMHSWIKTHTDSSSLCQIYFQFSALVDFVSPANCHQPESRAVGHPCNPCNPNPFLYLSDQAKAIMVSAIILFQGL